MKEQKNRKQENSEKAAFRSACGKLNLRLKSIRKAEPETVGDETAAKALIIIGNMRPEGVGDAFLFAAALNALEAYADQNRVSGKDIGNCFKNAASGLVSWLRKNPCEDVEIEIQQDQGMTLLAVDFCGVQFTFHQVYLNDESAACVAKDLSAPHLKPDGIRKQRCAETVFAFALQNRYCRSGRMSDGSPFSEGLSGQLNLYRSGALSLEDLKNRVYSRPEEPEEYGGKDASGRRRTRIPSSPARVYPYRSKPSATLYESVYSRFSEEIRKRELAGYLAERYEEGYGYSISEETSSEWKYVFEAVLYLLDSADCGADTGIRIECVRERNTETLLLLLAGTDAAGKVRASLVQLLSWERMKPSGNGDTVLYAEHPEEPAEEAVHPSFRLCEFVRCYEEDVTEPGNFELKACVWFYDATRKYGTDIVTGCREETLRKAPVFYADEKGPLTEYITPSIHAADGRKALVSFRNAFGTEGGKAVSEIEIVYIRQMLLRWMKKKKRFLAVLDGRANCGRTLMLCALKEILEAEGKKTVLIGPDSRREKIPQGISVLAFDGVIPENWNSAEAPYQIIFYDSFLTAGKEKRRIVQFRDRAEKEMIPLYCRTLQTAAGFRDMGRGNNWLIRHFCIGMVQPQEWDPTEYPVTLVNSETEFSGKDGFAAVRVPEAVHAGADGTGVVFEGNSRRELYLALAGGKKGVELLISDPVLRERIGNELDAAVCKYDWIRRFMEEYGGDISRLRDVQEEIFRHRSVRKKYEQEAENSLGRSAWKKMSEESRQWVLSALLGFHDMKEYDQLLDFSRVVVQICKAVESELRNRFMTSFTEWAKQKYGNACTDHLPETLLERRRGRLQPTDPLKLSLGSITYCMGMSAQGTVVSRNDREMFAAYAADTELFSGPEPVPQEKLEDLCRIIEHIRVNYRNRAAHQESMSAVDASECIDYCIRKERKLGVILDWMRR